MTIVIEIDGKAVAKGRGRVGMVGGHPTVYTPKETRSYENLVKMKASQVMAGRNPIEGSVEALVDVYVLVPAGFSKKKKAEALAGKLRPITRPDLDNFQKSCFDGINGIVIKDDSQIVKITANKFYSLRPRMRVEIIDRDAGHPTDII